MLLALIHHVSPREERFRPSVWPHMTQEAFSMLGEALIDLLLRHHYHMGKGCQGRQEAIKRRLN